MGLEVDRTPFCTDDGRIHLAHSAFFLFEAQKLISAEKSIPNFGFCINALCGLIMPVWLERAKWNGLLGIDVQFLLHAQTPNPLRGILWE